MQLAEYTVVRERTTARRAALVSLALLLTTSACTPSRVDLEQLGSVRLVVRAPDDLTLSASAYDEMGKFVILGRASRSPMDKSAVPGHIDVLITERDGLEVARFATPLHRLPTGPRRYPNRSNFFASLPNIPANGSIVTITLNESSF